MKKLAQWQYSMPILHSKGSDPFIYLMGRQYLPGPWIAILFLTQHTHNHLQPCFYNIFTYYSILCAPIFCFIMKHTKWTYEIQCQTLIAPMEMFVTLEARLVGYKIGCSLIQPKILVYWPSYTKVAQPMKKLAQWQYSMSILHSKGSDPFIYLMGWQYLPGPWIAISFFTQHTHNHLQPCFCHIFT